MSSPGDLTQTIEVKLDGSEDSKQPYSGLPEAASVYSAGSQDSFTGSVRFLRNRFAFASDADSSRQVTLDEQEYSMYEEMLAVAALRVDASKIYTKLQNVKAKVEEFNAAMEGLTAEVAAYEHQRNELAKANEPHEEKLAHLENELMAFRATFIDGEVTKTKVDIITEEKMGLEILKVKIVVVTARIRMLECEDAPDEKKQQLSETTAAMQESVNMVEQYELDLLALQENIKAADAAWKDKWGIIDIKLSQNGNMMSDHHVKDGSKSAESRHSCISRNEEDAVSKQVAEENEKLKAKLQSMEEVNKKQSEELEALRFAKRDNGDDAFESANSKSDSANVEGSVNSQAVDEVSALQAELQATKEIAKKTAEELEAVKAAKANVEGESIDGSASRRGSACSTMSAESQAKMAALEKEKQAVEDAKRAAEQKAKLLETRIDQMLPLWNIGYLTRGRKIENVKDKTKFQPLHALIDQGNEAYFGFNPLADASLFLSAGVKQQSHREFVALYGVAPLIVWEQKDSEVFLNVLTWKAEMSSRLRMYSTMAFRDACKKLFSRISPSYKLDVKMIQADATLRGWYEVMEKEFSNAKKAYEKAHAHHKRGTGGGKSPSSRSPTNSPPLRV